jgi:predicted RNA binding protein YcfA (HicA-like mRNA interferase family)
MPKVKVLSGGDVISILSNFGFLPVAQRGSHVKLRRILSGGERQTLTIPNHKDLDCGTRVAIYRQALRYIPEQELRPYFYAD